MTRRTQREKDERSPVVRTRLPDYVLAEIQRRAKAWQRSRRVIQLRDNLTQFAPATAEDGPGARSARWRRADVMHDSTPEPPGRHLGGIRWLPLEALGLSEAARFPLRCAQIANVGELLAFPPDALVAQFRGYKPSLERLRQCLAQLRIRLPDGLPPQSDPVIEPERTLEEATPLEVMRDLNVSHPERGWVYFIQVENGGPIKIGVSVAHPVNRMAELQCACPYGLELIATTFGRLKVETALHSRFAHLRLRGEWFRPAPELLDWINRFGKKSHDGPEPRFNFD